MEILLIDDDIELGEALTMYLEGFQHSVVCATRPSAGYEELEARQPDLLLLDIMLPEQDGLSVCRMIRESGKPYSDIPIIMLTAQGDVTDRVVGLEVGADDYLPKPFNPRELLARIHSVMRRQRKSHLDQTTGSATEAKPASRTGLSIDADKRRVWLDDELIDLSTMEYELLTLLHATPGKKWSRDELISSLRGTDAELYSRSVDTLVSRLRQKLGDSGKPTRFIQTVWGYGYCFLGPDDEKT
jgi:OmpR family response regulator RpaB